MLGEFFAADPADIDDALLDHGPFGRYATIEAKTIDSVSISTLGEILGVGTYDELVEEVSNGPALASGEAGLFVIPTRMRDALAAAVDEAPAIAAKWHATEEISGWYAEDVRTVVLELVALAQRAANESQQLLFWWSL